MLDSGEYHRIKTKAPLKVGREFEPNAQLIKLEWFIMSPGQEFDHNIMLLTQTSQSDYKDLCRLDVLGLQDLGKHNQGVVYAEFKEKLRRNSEGWYEAVLPWKGNHPELPSNKQGSLHHLKSLTQKLK